MELVNAEDGSSQSVNSAETDNVGKAGVENADMEKNTAEQSAESTVGEHAGDAVQNSAGLDRQVAAALGEQLAFQTSEGNREVIRCGDGHGTFTGNIYEAYSIRRGMRRQPGGSRNGAGGLCTIFGVQGDPDGIFENNLSV